ncbi:hypothetical protein CerSpe_211010 [Prunus speciosa]
MSNTNENHQAVPLSVLLKLELVNEKIGTERPEIVHGQVSQSKKGEDYAGKDGMFKSCGRWSFYVFNFWLWCRSHRGIAGGKRPLL